MKEEMPFKIGSAYLFRCVTYHLIGKVKAIKGKFLELENASWLVDSGRFSQCIQNGIIEEIEPVGIAIINASAIVDAFPWKHKLPSEQK